jgi:hypothetical protein
MLFVAIAVFALAITAASVLRAKPMELQIAGAIFYGAAAIVLVQTVQSGTVHGRLLWETVLAGQAREWRIPLLSESRQVRRRSSLVRYMVLPRPSEFLVKPWCLGLASAFGYLLSSQQGVAHWLSNTVVFVLGIEFFLYQARYIWNDLAGLEEDSYAPEFKAGTRFPQSTAPEDMPSYVRWGVLNIVVRTFLSAWLGLRFLVGNQVGVYFVTGAAVVGVATLYEWLRRRTASRPFEGELSVEQRDSLVRLKPMNAAVLELVGAGYAIRAIAGLSVGSSKPVQPLGGLLVVASLTAFGSMFVAMTWAIDGLHYRDWSARSVRLDSSLYLAPHRASLMCHANLLGEDSKPSAAQVRGSRGRAFYNQVSTSTARDVARQPKGGLDRRWRPLITVDSLRAWWNIQLIIACAFGAAAGYELTSAQSFPAVLAVEFALGAAAGAILAIGYGRNSACTIDSVSARQEQSDARDSAGDRGVYLAPLLPGAQLYSVGLLLMAVGGLSAAANSKQWYLAPIPLLAVLSLYGWFRRASLEDIEITPEQLFRGLGHQILRLLYHAATGAFRKTAADHLFGNGGLLTKTPPPKSAASVRLPSLPPVVSGPIAGLCTFLAGFSVLWVAWMLNPGPAMLPSLFDYRSATLGDGLLLPLTGTALVYIIDATPGLRNRRAVAGAFLAGAAIGAATQVVAFADARPVLNWTMPERRQLTPTGWYHAALLTTLSGCFAAFWFTVIRKLWSVRRSQQANGKIVLFCYLTAGASNVAFAGLVMLDIARSGHGHNEGSLASGSALVAAAFVWLTASLALLVWPVTPTSARGRSGPPRTGPSPGSGRTRSAARRSGSGSSRPGSRRR